MHLLPDDDKLFFGYEELASYLGITKRRIKEIKEDDFNYDAYEIQRIH